MMNKIPYQKKCLSTPCIYCGSNPKIINRVGRKVSSGYVRCSSGDCQHRIKLTYKEWVLRFNFHKNKNFDLTVKRVSNYAGHNSKFSSCIGGISALARINHINEKIVFKDKSERECKGRQTVEDWVVLAIRWAKEFGRIRISEIESVYGHNISTFTSYHTRVNLVPKKEDSVLWERLKDIKDE